VNCKPIGLDRYITQVYQMHISKNSYIKPHIDMSDLDASFISWFAKGNPYGGCFGIFQHSLKFDNNNGAGIFVLRKFIIHGTLNIDLNLLSHIIFKLGFALVNKRWLCTRLQNQLWDGTSMIWENNLWYTRMTSNGGPCSDEELDSECDDELDSDNKST
jgi:hypothetical protein